MKNAKLLLRKIFFIAAVITAMTVTGCKQPVKKDKGGEVKTFAVTVTQPLNGTITVKKGGELLNGAALKAVAENSEIEITLTAESGYKTVKLVVDGAEETQSKDGGITISKTVKVTKALSISGNVVQESTPLKTFAVTVTQPTNGTITVKKGGELLNGAALKAVEENTELEITLTAKDGYKTVKLIVGDEEKTDSTDNGKTITKKVTVTKALTVRGEIVQNKSFTVSGVTFKMYDIESVKGAELGHTGQIDNKPRTVNLSAYSIGKTEVTQELYEAVMGENPSHFDGSGEEKVTPKDEIQNKRPVENLNWYAAVSFCNSLTKKINGGSETECVYYSDAAFQHIYTKENANNKELPYMNISKKGFRLPTEAEWEWACMGGKKNKWAGTDNKDSLKDYAWFLNPDNFGTDPLNYVTHQTGLKKQNGYQLFDMSGNAAEWCWDWYGKNLVSGETDPAGAKNGKYRVIRGGSFINTSEECECSFRSNREPHKAELTIGFRIVCRM